MITNELIFTFDYEAIRKDFIIFKISHQGSNYYNSLIPDIARQSTQALSVVYQSGASCYMLCRRGTEKSSFQYRLESEDPDTEIVEIQPDGELYEYSLAQLLCNALPALQNSYLTYNNTLGKLFYRSKHNVHKNSFSMVEIHLTFERCVSLPVTTFMKASSASPAPKGAQYLFDNGSGELRRAMPADIKSSGNLYVKKACSNTKQNVCFLDFSDVDNFESSKSGILNDFLNDVTQYLNPYLKIELQHTPEEKFCIQSHSLLTSDVYQNLRSVPLYLEDCVKNEASELLETLLSAELAENHIDLKYGTPVPGSALLRIVHDKDFYEKQNLYDPYRTSISDCAVQHLTLEQFGKGIQNKNQQHAIVRKILQELSIKLDLVHGQLRLFNWKALGLTHDQCFVTATQANKNAPIRFHRLTISPDGTLRFDSWQKNQYFDDADYSEIENHFMTNNQKNPRLDKDVEGLVYEPGGQFFVIRKTKCFTVPELDPLYKILSATPKQETLELAPIIAVVQSITAQQCGADYDRCCTTLMHLQNLGETATRDVVRKKLNLKSKIGKYLNDAIYRETGILISGRLKESDRMEKLFGSLLDIRWYMKDNSLFYYSGRRTGDVQNSFARACNIRQVTSNSDPANFQNYLPLLAVDFVYAAGWTVLPFPFKYLREHSLSSH